MYAIANGLYNGELEWNKSRGGVCNVHQKYRPFYARLLLATYPHLAKNIHRESVGKPTMDSDRKWVAHLRAAIVEVGERKLKAVPNLDKRSRLLGEFCRATEQFLEDQKAFLKLATLADRNGTAAGVPWTQLLDACEVIGIAPPCTPEGCVDLVKAKRLWSEKAHFYHPDKNHSLSEELQKDYAVQLQAINDARDTLRAWNAGISSFPTKL